MEPNVRLVWVELDSDDGVFVTFSDGATAGYVVEELLELRPFRFPVEVSPTHGDRVPSDPQGEQLGHTPL